MHKNRGKYIVFGRFWPKIFDQEPQQQQQKQQQQQQQQQEQEEHMTPCKLGAGGPCRGAAWIKRKTDKERERERERTMFLVPGPCAESVKRENERAGIWSKTGTQKKILYFEWSPPWHFKIRFYVSLIGSGEGRHTTHLLKYVLLLSTSQTDWTQSSDILSNISFGILSDISSDISSDILSDISFFFSWMLLG